MLINKVGTRGIEDGVATVDVAVRLSMSLA